MSSHSPDLPSRFETSQTVPCGWRLVQFVVLSGLVIALEQVIEIWLLPGPSAELAVAQLESSDGPAESLRLFETLRGFLPGLTALAILFIGLALFVRGYAAKFRCYIAERKPRL